MSSNGCHTISGRWRFQLLFVERYLLLFFVWVALCVFVPPQRARSRLRGMVIGALVISLAGLLISVLLRKRTSDGCQIAPFLLVPFGRCSVPVGVALQGAVFVRQLLTARPRVGRLALAAGLFVAGWQMAPLPVERLSPGVPRADVLAR